VTLFQTLFFTCGSSAYVGTGVLTDTISTEMTPIHWIDGKTLNALVLVDSFMGLPGS
jgi:hypothetical protein